MPAFGDSRRCDRPGCGQFLKGNSDVGDAFPCGHRICVTCQGETDDIEDQTRTEQATVPERDSADCPVCQQKTLLPAERLKDTPILCKFRTVSEVFDVLGPWYCQKCSEKNKMLNSSEILCAKCDVKLCNQCAVEHVRDAKLLAHLVITKDDYVQGKNWGSVTLKRSDKRLKVKCLKHTQQYLIYLCLECKKLNCEDCLSPCSCKQCKKRIRACDVTDDVTAIVTGISSSLNDGVRWAEQDLETVQKTKDEVLADVEKLKAKVTDEIHQRHWVNEHMACLDEDKPTDDQVDLIENHITDIQTRCGSTERKLRFASNGKRLLKQAITYMRLIDSQHDSNYAILLLAFLQFNRHIQDMSYKEDVKKTLYFVTKTKCMYHQNAPEEISAFPESIQTGTVQVKPVKKCITTLFTKAHKTDKNKPYIAGLTVLEHSNNIIISDSGNKCLKCFAAKALPCSPVQLPEYEYKLEWRSEGGCGRDIENPGVIYTTFNSKLIGLVDNSAVFEYDPIKGKVKCAKMCPNIVGDCTHNDALERLSAKVMYQTHKINAYISTSLMSDALQSGIVLPQFLANLHVTPWFYFTKKSEKHGRVVISTVLSGFEKLGGLDENKRGVVLFLNNGLLLRTVYVPHEEPPGISYNTADKCVYIADYKYNRVVAFTEKGKFSKIFLDADDGIVKPIHLVFDIQGRLVVAQEDGCLKIFQRDDEVVIAGVPQVKPPTYKYFVPAVNTLPPDSDEELDFDKMKF